MSAAAACALAFELILLGLSLRDAKGLIDWLDRDGLASNSAIVERFSFRKSTFPEMSDSFDEALARPGRSDGEWHQSW